MYHAHLTSHHRTDGICNYDGACGGGLYDPPCFKAGEFVLEFKDDPCEKCGNPRRTVCCERHTHLVLERIGSTIKSVLPAHQDTKELQRDIDKELEDMR